MKRSKTTFRCWCCGCEIKKPKAVIRVAFSREWYWSYCPPVSMNGTLADGSINIPTIEALRELAGQMRFAFVDTPEKDPPLLICLTLCPGCVPNLGRELDNIKKKARKNMPPKDDPKGHKAVRLEKRRQEVLGNQPDKISIQKLKKQMRGNPFENMGIYDGSRPDE